MKFDYSDYLSNPNKYKLFKTATVSNLIVSQEGSVPKGTIVGLKHLGDRFNPLYRRTEPLYALSTGDVCYANGLHSFVL